MQLEYKGAKILTKYDPPPIPGNDHDWTAWVDGYEEDGLAGWGKTEQEAIDDLMELLDIFE